MSSRDKMLNKIRQALETPVPLPFEHITALPKDVFLPSPAAEELDILFAEQFVKAQGQFSYSANASELILQLKQLISSRGWQKILVGEHLKSLFLENNLALPLYNGDVAGCDVAITSAEYLIARTGSFILSSSVSGGRVPSVYAPVHVCIAQRAQVVYDIADALELLHKKYGEDFPSSITLATGPSRTADIEKTLVTGVHGPHEVFCFLAEALAL